MIFRRIKAHVAKEDWFAVFIDFIIVVFGVFMGMQVSNWNDARSTSQKEKVYLVELRQEVGANIDQLQNKIKLVETVVASGEKSLDFLDRDTPCETACWPLLVDFFLASQVMAVPTDNTVLNEMQRLGLPRSPEIRAALSHYILRDRSTAFVSQDLPKYRENVRSLIPVKVLRTLWKDCHQTIPIEAFFPDCEATIAETDVIAVLEKIRGQQGLQEQLNLWIGHNDFVLPTHRDLIVAGEDVITAINHELETRP